MREDLESSELIGSEMAGKQDHVTIHFLLLTADQFIVPKSGTTIFN